MKKTLYQPPLYHPDFEHDACGTGFVADIQARPSRKILDMGLECLNSLAHRGAVSADAKSGDGAGLLTQIPYKILKKYLASLGVALDKDNDLGVGMIFFPQDEDSREKCKRIILQAIEYKNLNHLGWREVPVDRSVIGSSALETCPVFEQILIGRPDHLDEQGFEKALFVVRKKMEHDILADGMDDFYVASFSHYSVVYKGMLVASQMNQFFLDLNEPEFETSYVVLHSRFSTNTFPSWELAQPFRMIAHNGEINTIRSNRNWMKAREADLSSGRWEKDAQHLKPLVSYGGSDSETLDNAMEFLVRSGRDILHTSLMLIPEAWENMPHLQPDRRAFYEYHACLMEPWDGPAAIAFSDGKIVGAHLDRNGLRPARYIVTDDDIVVMGSEVGLVDIPPARIIKKGRLGPGMTIAIDLTQKRFILDDEIKNRICNEHPYQEWLRAELRRLKRSSSVNKSDREVFKDITQWETMFGYTSEELQRVVIPMVLDGKEPVGSMGDDTPITVLARRSRLLYSYFRQLFAQVTNPPIDPIREELVMSSNSFLGRNLDFLETTKEHAHFLELSEPILTNSELEQIKTLDDPAFNSVSLDATFPISDGEKGLEDAVDRLCEDASEIVEKGATVLILSDRNISAERAPIPMLLAVSGVHQHLISEGKRLKVSLIAETAEPRDVHHFACLLGHGVRAINPYLVFEIIHDLVEKGDSVTELSLDQAFKHYSKAVKSGILKIMSKMGIATLASYVGAQNFEAVGLEKEMIDKYFAGTHNPIGGATLEDISRELLERHQNSFHIGEEKNKRPIKLEFGGDYKYKKNGEFHAFNPKMVHALQKAVKTGDYEVFQEYIKLVQDRESPASIRDMLRFKTKSPIPLEQVEPIEAICKRFRIAQMSHGALGSEVHEALAIGINRVGGMGGSGEGGEDPARFKKRANGDWANCHIKQVASGRFGVTTEYLMNAFEINIKMAQGSKPGEGGQLPGHKVTEEIAKIRCSIPGVTLISPPPHHDIYSIEDLAQLIYDLKQVNPDAKVSVKLVAESGVGTVAAGVAKAYADTILISGHEGGTGASALSSIKYAGSPWELGLAETQQVLVMNDLRGRVRIHVDGGMKTGLDVVIAAMLGAEEYGFGTAPVVATGCLMIRVCHLNTCPTGIATQKPELRKKFTGKPEMVEHFFKFVAMHVRELLAELGFRSLDEIVGQVQLLEQIPSEEMGVHKRAGNLNLTPLLANPDPSGKLARKATQDRNDREEKPLDDTILEDIGDAIELEKNVSLSYPIHNTDRTVGTRVAGVIAKRFGNKGLKQGTIECSFTGSAGQSFGAFLVNGMRLVLEGEANDYVGKGMCGGEIIIFPPVSAQFEANKNIIIGNTIMYGATGGILYAAGRAGERFCVRNSGGYAVIEGVGDHGCEYMTGGVVLCLGETGRNFGAGMTGGVAYVLDEEGQFPQHYNPELVLLERVTHLSDMNLVKTMLEAHISYTNSEKARAILEDFENVLPLFWKLVPNSPEAITRPEELLQVSLTRVLSQVAS